MKKLILKIIVWSSVVATTGCATVASGWSYSSGQSSGQVVYTSDVTGEVVTNEVVFRLNAPYCSVKISSDLEKYLPGQKKNFNPVKEDFVLYRQGEEKTLVYRFNTNNHYRTRVYWYKNGRLLNVQYVGHPGSGDTLVYDINNAHLGRIVINLNNYQRQECWRKDDGDIRVIIQDQNNNQWRRIPQPKGGW
ncbi:hypothetical protein CSB11_01215 [Candidatus Campbellbacteria bacterium]|nr:MAG: hypothetical protein CSB11_01215 [Candidatus Campbellbacteria bacterium]